MWMKAMWIPAWETTDGGDGKPEFRDVYRRVTLDPIAVGTAREEELHFAKGLDACEMKPQSDTV